MEIEDTIEKPSYPHPFLTSISLPVNRQLSKHIGKKRITFFEANKICPWTLKKC